jgi:hypothetical protein
LEDEDDELARWLDEVMEEQNAEDALGGEADAEDLARMAEAGTNVSDDEAAEQLASELPGGPGGGEHLAAEQLASEVPRLKRVLQETFRLALKNAVSRGRAELRASRDAAAATGPIIMDRAVSLVEHRVAADETAVIFVTWTNADEYKGRRLSLDRYNRVKTIVGYMIPVEDFRGARFRISTVPITLVIAAASDRPQMPDWCLIVQKWAQALKFSGPLAPLPSGVSRCLFCNCADELGHERGVQESQAKPMDKFEFICSQCLCIWHSACVGIVQHDAQMPTDSEAFLCPVCVGIA